MRATLTRLPASARSVLGSDPSAWRANAIGERSPRCSVLARASASRSLATSKACRAALTASVNASSDSSTGAAQPPGDHRRCDSGARHARYPHAVWIRPLIIAGIGVAGAALGYLAVMWHGAWALPAAAVLALAALGTWDLVQPRHTILRLYPILGHVRFLMELIRPEIRQYFIESNTEASPFDRETRDMVYERAKGTKGDEPFGTERDVNAVGYEYLRHSTGWVRR